MSKLQIAGSDITNASKIFFPGISFEKGSLVWGNDLVQVKAKSFKLATEASATCLGIQVSLSAVNLTKDGIDVDFDIATSSAK